MLIAILQVTVNGLLLAMIFAALAVGLDLIFGVLRIINFAYGDFLMIALFVVFFAVGAFQLPIALAGVLAVAGMLLVSFLFWLGVLPLGENQERQMLATFGIGILLQEVGNLVFGAQVRTLDSSLTSSTFRFGDVAVVQYTLVAALICAALVIAVLVVMRKSRFGLQLRAFAANEAASRLYGVDRRKIMLGALGISAACIGIAATSLLPTLYVSPTIGLNYTVLIYMMVIIGGTGSIVGAIVGAVIVELAMSVGSLWLPGSLPMNIVVIILLVILATRPQGLFGAKHAV